MTGRLVGGMLGIHDERRAAGVESVQPEGGWFGFIFGLFMFSIDLS
ncbi:hypothetical protein ENSA7_40510 [Enhygromyxa salina]|uniref:Uncharacterized protein n=1 Tax=Enhygromyxa salina TaxID=215803 RepID=A0A2S9YMF0_9BACT|nr:hypothetical protein ENSA7_40510 [Enhygromyxa salina]